MLAHGPRQAVPQVTLGVKRTKIMIDAVRKSWGWTGIDPAEIIRTSPFGNLLVRDRHDRVWRMTPEELGCYIVAETDAALKTLLSDPEFLRDWEMTCLVDLAASVLGDPGDDRCYCLKVPAVLGGSYQQDNLATITRHELIRASGTIARQVDGLPDGATVRLKVVE